VKRETIAIHGGYEVDPATKAVAVPIYQTVAYAFDSADHGAALFNLEVEGYRYTRIANPTTEVLERRVAALEGGVDALCVSSGQAAVHYALLNAEELGVTKANVDQMAKSENPEIKRLLGTEGKFGEAIGLSNDWAVRIIRHVGNYGESFERNVGEGSPLKVKRGLNALWNKGGLQYGIPVR